MTFHRVPVTNALVCDDPKCQRAAVLDAQAISNKTMPADGFVALEHAKKWEPYACCVCGLICFSEAAKTTHLTRSK